VFPLLQATLPSPSLTTTLASSIASVTSGKVTVTP
jgi:hypothetical protein